MSARDVPGCAAERHREGVGRVCMLADGHDGAHWTLVPISGGYRPTSWEGTDGPVKVEIGQRKANPHCAGCTAQAHSHCWHCGRLSDLPHAKFCPRVAESVEIGGQDA